GGGRGQGRGAGGGWWQGRGAGPEGVPAGAGRSGPAAAADARPANAGHDGPAHNGGGYRLATKLRPEEWAGRRVRAALGRRRILGWWLGRRRVLRRRVLRRRLGRRGSERRIVRGRR